MSSRREVLEGAVVIGAAVVLTGCTPGEAPTDEATARKKRINDLIRDKSNGTLHFIKEGTPEHDTVGGNWISPKNEENNPPITVNTPTLTLSVKTHNVKDRVFFTGTWPGKKVRPNH